MAELKRKFIYENKEYPDPDPAMTVDDVRQNYAQFFPELASAETKSEVKKKGTPDQYTEYTFKKRVGTKG